MLKKLVNGYMRDQWVNHQRDIGFYAAKAELLSLGGIMFCEPGTTTPKYVYQDEELENMYPLPVMADVNGDFGKMHLDGGYSLTVSNYKGESLLITTTRPDFDIDA
jgi:hypothetical protein